LFSNPNGLPRIGAAVARDYFQGLAKNPALGVDFLNRPFPTLFVGIEKRGLRFITVELADLDGVLRRRRRHKAGGEEASNSEILHMTLDHDFVPFVADNRAILRYTSPPAGELVCTQIVRPWARGV